jgi:hypothetical protein
MGGHMVRRMIQDAELRLAQGTVFPGGMGGGGYGYTR